MAYSTSYTSFTITQPFLGAPLQFIPALGSDEFELLISCYVTGSGSKQDKLSQVTIDFYNTATVDLNTGALTKTYEVFPAWTGETYDLSPTQSHSSGFSPAIFTPSPGSSATLGDSYSSLSMTPPTRTSTSSSRVTKKSKKETKKTAEARLPGFSIMTKDGIDVTSSAGRGTKTKEQREHAHLMRQLKACADCKRKKIRCDPAHRRSHNDMSRTSTSNASSSSRANPSPTASTPSVQETAATSFNPSYSFEDFILFPDETAPWNPADLSMNDFAAQDLSQFNFDISELDTSSYAPLSPSMDFAFASHGEEYYSSPQSASNGTQIPMTQQQTRPQFQDGTSPFAPFQFNQHDLNLRTEPQGYSMNSATQTRPQSAGQYTCEHEQCNDCGFLDHLGADDRSSSDYLRHAPSSSRSNSSVNALRTQPRTEHNIDNRTVLIDNQFQDVLQEYANNQQLANAPRLDVPQQVPLAQDGLVIVSEDNSARFSFALNYNDSSSLSIHATDNTVEQPSQGDNLQSLPSHGDSQGGLPSQTLPAGMLGRTSATELVTFALLSSFALMFLSGTLELVRETTVSWANDGSWGSVARLMICGALVAFLPEVVDSWSFGQSHGCWALSALLLNTLSCLAGDGVAATSDDNCFLFSTTADNDPRPSLLNPFSRQAPNVATRLGHSGFFLGLMQHLTPLVSTV